MKKKIEALGLTITELSEYLRISRPTTYKIIEMYENGQFGNLKKQYFDLMEYIDKTQFLDKLDVILWIQKNCLEMDNILIKKNECPNNKFQLIQNVLQSEDDQLIDWLNKLFTKSLPSIKKEVLKKWAQKHLKRKK